MSEHGIAIGVTPMAMSMAMDCMVFRENETSWGGGWGGGVN